MNRLVKLTLCLVLAVGAGAWAVSRAPTPPMEKRVQDSGLVFVGKVVNRVQTGEWVKAELLVEQPLKNARKGDQVPVTWRVTVGNFFIYDAAEGARGIAILGDQHRGRYWLRADKFEPLEKLPAVQALTAKPRALAEDARIQKLKKRAEQFAHLDYPFLAPSTHLWYVPPKPNAPYHAFYNEMTVEKSYHGSYFMACGFNCGYFGIQEIGKRKLVLFSLWDSGGGKNQQQDVEEERRVKVLYSNPQGKTSRFGGEGSGAKTMLDYPWKTGCTYRFLVTHRLESDGAVYTGWFRGPEDRQWTRMATCKTPTKFKSMKGFYCFVEDFIRNGETGQHVRKVYYPNPWLMTRDGDWLQVKTVNNTIANDYFQNAHGGKEKDRFYLQSGADTRHYDKNNRQFTVTAEKPKPVDLPDEITKAGIEPRPHH